jgi:hypothetical protein
MLKSKPTNLDLNHLLHGAVTLRDTLFFFFSFFFLFIYSHVHTLFGSFLPSAPAPTLSPLPSSVSGWPRSALVTDFVEEKTSIIRKTKRFC